ncbi:hypothetical protein CJ030_MR2G025550 [Morella rubra]|uniref:Uncharacterized protein n=1 Tax=Morella rubra TaxID=262757 RepID=A0A6A1WJH9_9ROSI|nr:hypothetical protein CJ030_MR2G025550 [Morella rubra]
MKAFLIISLLLVSLLFALPSTTLAGELAQGGDPGSRNRDRPNNPAFKACGNPTGSPQYQKCIDKLKKRRKCGTYNRCNPPEGP